MQESYAYELHQPLGDIWKVLLITRTLYQIYKQSKHREMLNVTRCTVNVS